MIRLKWNAYELLRRLEINPYKLVKWLIDNDPTFTARSSAAIYNACKDDNQRGVTLDTVERVMSAVKGVLEEKRKANPIPDDEVFELTVIDLIVEV